LETGMPEFLLDLWIGEAGRTKEQIESVLKKARRKLRLIIEVTKHPDNTPELLNGSLQTGLIFLPSNLMKDLYRLGEMAADALDYRKKPGTDMEREAA